MRPSRTRSTCSCRRAPRRSAAPGRRGRRPGRSPWAVGLLLGDERGGVVAAGLGRAHTAAAGTGVVGGEPERDRHRAAAEVGAGGRSRSPGRSRARPAGPRGTGLGGDHEGAQVEALLAGRAGPSAGRRDERLDGLARSRRSGSSGRARRRLELLHALGVRLGPERPDAAVGVAVGLEALEDLLGVVEDGGRRVERERTVRRDRGARASRRPGPTSPRNMWSVK